MMKNTLNLRSSKETHHSDMLVYAHVPQLYVQIIRSSKTLMSMENGCVCMTIRLQFYDTLMQKKKHLSYSDRAYYNSCLYKLCAHNPVPYKFSLPD